MAAPLRQQQPHLRGIYQSALGDDLHLILDWGPDRDPILKLFYPFFLNPKSKIGNRKSKMSSYDSIRSRQHIRRDREADLLRRVQIDDEPKLLWLLHREISGQRRSKSFPRMWRRAQDVVSLSNHGGRGEEGVEREAGRPASRPYIFFLRLLRPLRLNSSSRFF